MSRQCHYKCLHTPFRKFCRRTARLAASPLGQRGNAALYVCEFLPEIRQNYARKYVYVTYDDTT